MPWFAKRGEREPIINKAEFSLSGKKVWVAGHRGMVGSAIVHRLADENCELVFAGRDIVDLRRQAEVESWMDDEKPQAIFLAAATVGGILANDTRPAEFIFDNIAIEANIIDAAYRNGVEKLLFLGSSCIYPKQAPQPMAEDCLLTGAVEPTNQWYAMAKIAGIKMCQAYRRQYGCDYISAVPTNLYGPGDNYDLQGSHVIPALLAKMHLARIGGDGKVGIWGTGTPKREFLYVDDLADALVFLMKNYSEEIHINVGTGEDVTIADLSKLVAKTVGFSGDLEFDSSKPDGTMRKLLDVSRLSALGWSAKTSLSEGLGATYSDFLKGARNFDSQDYVA